MNTPELLDELEEMFPNVHDVALPRTAAFVKSLEASWLLVPAVESPAS